MEFNRPSELGGNISHVPQHCRGLVQPGGPDLNPSSVGNSVIDNFFLSSYS